MRQELKNIDYATQRTGLKKARVYELVRLNLIPSVKIGRQVRYDPDQLEAWIERGGQALPGGWREER